MKRFYARKKRAARAMDVWAFESKGARDEWVKEAEGAEALTRREVTAFFEHGAFWHLGGNVYSSSTRRYENENRRQITWMTVEADVEAGLVPKGAAQEPVGV